VWPDLIPEPTPQGLEKQIAKGLVCIGTPDEVERAVQRYAEIGADQLTFGQLSTTMPIEVAVEAVETFGKHVLGKFDTDPVHSTTRQREAWLASRPAGAAGGESGKSGGPGGPGEPGEPGEPGLKPLIV
jgi:alkanesulfonate monooxygenase SsuD/methylene tetrahydromethanopterin reductase-like flavin-dependent oxidoreductase (luciferase family)